MLFDSDKAATSMPTKEQVLATLKAHQAELESEGVQHIALFGSLARGENTPESDIDLFVDLRDDFRGGVWQYTGIILKIQDLFDTKIDVANRRSLTPRIKPAAERDALYAF